MISAASFPAAGASPVMPTSVTDLDDNTPATPQPTYAASTSLSFPYALAFTPRPAGPCGRLDLAADVDRRRGRHRRKTMELSDASLGIQGLVLRTLEVLPATQNILGYCQQSNNVLVWSLAPFKVTPVRALSLGNDPAPRRSSAAARSGTTARARSTGARAATPATRKAARTAWCGRSPTFPWTRRGRWSLSRCWASRTASPTTGAASARCRTSTTPSRACSARPRRSNPVNGELDDFLEFVFLAHAAGQPAPGPRPAPEELAGDRPAGTGVVPTPLVGSPVSGADDFVNQVQDGIFGNGSCASCHMLPTGSNGDFFADKPDPVVTKAVIEVVHSTRTSRSRTSAGQRAVHRLRRQPQDLPLAGARLGILHDGRVLNLFAFVDDFFGISDQRVADITTFLQLFDSGTHPGVHAVMRLAPGSPPAR
jgi:hypothetical protein